MSWLRRLEAFSMEFLIMVSDSVDADEQRSLHELIQGQPELRAGMRAHSATVDGGRLGSLIETLAVILGPGGAATALISVLVSWLRRRRSDVVIKVTRPDGGVVVEISASNVRDLDLSEVRVLVNDVSATLESSLGEKRTS
jgi:membrane-associated two-gene conflict system component 1 (EACC1)